MKKIKSKIRLTLVIVSVLLMPFIKQSGNTVHAQADTWVTKASNPGSTGRSYGVGFSIGTKGYIGVGRFFADRNDFWEYDPTADAWTQKAVVPGGTRVGAMGFSIGSKGYIGGGYNSGFTNSMYEYDPSTNVWTAKANLPTARYEMHSFAVGTKGYMGGGYDGGSNYLADFYEFDPIANTWIAKTPVPGAGRGQCAGFTIGSKGYVCAGYLDNGSGVGTNDLYEYDPATNTWTQKASIGGPGRMSSIGLAINGKGYVGSGYGAPSNNYINDFWEYTPGTNTWVQKSNIPGSGRAQGMGFAIGTKGYLGMGSNGSPLGDFYEYSTCGAPITVSPSSAFLCNSGTVALTASGATTYTWSNGMANGGTATPTVTTHYTVTGATTGTCPVSNSAVVTVVVSTLAANQTITPATSTFACNGSANINLTTEAGVNYYLRNDANNAILAGPYTGTGSTLTIPTGNFSTTTTFNINAKRTSGGLTFDGVDDGIKTPGAPFNFGGDFTFEAWVKSPVGANSGLNLVFGLPGNTDMWVGFSNGYPAFALGGSGGNTIVGNTLINDGKWHHIAAVRTSGIKNLYVDGILAGTQTNANALTPNSTFEVGSYGGGFNFKGQIDEVRVYNTGLTQPQVAASMTACATGSETGLLTYYNFEDGAGSGIASDIAGMDNNATLVNMNTTTAWSDGVESCIACAATQMTTKPVLTITPISNQTLTTVNPNICVSGTGTINTSGSNTNIDYFLRDNSNNAIISGPVAGTGSALSFTTGNITSTKTYNIFAKSQSAYLDFDGADDYVLSTNTAGIPAGNSPYTIEALIKPDAVNGSGTIVSWGNHGANNEACSFRLAGTGQLTNYWWANDITVGAGNLADGAWHHVAATYDGATRSIFVDGVLVGSDTPGANNITVTNNLTVGGSLMSNGSTFNFYKGGMDEVRVWNIARTQAQIAANMNSSLLGSETGLSVYYKFAEGTGSTTAKDLAGGNNNGTFTNMNAATAWQYYSAPCSLQMSNTPTVTVNALPTVSVNSPSVCSGYSVALVPAGAATYTITGGTFTVTPSATTAYSVTGTSSVGCVSSNTAVANVTVVASPTLSVNNPTICSGNSVAIVPTGASASYTITGNTFTVTPLTTTSYTVTGTNSNGCVSLSSKVSTVTVNATPTLAVNSGSICSNNSFVIIPSGANTYTVTGGAFTVSPLTTTSYSVTGTGANGCISASPAISTVTVFATPTLAVNSATICSGNSVAIVPTGANTYTITGGNYTVTPLTTTSYSVTGTSTAGCISSNTAVASVSVNATPTIAVNSGSICSNNSFVILPSGAGTYTITGGTFTVTPLTTTSYSVTGTGNNGCISASAAVSGVTVFATPTLAVNSGSICSGKSFTIIPTNASTYTITGNNFTVTPLTTTSYSVTGTSTEGCVSFNTVVSIVTVFATPTLAVNSATVCSGNSVAIVASGANTYTITGNNFTVTPLTTTSYSVTGTSTAGCISASSAVSQVSVNATPTIAVNSGSICSGKSFTIVPSGANTYTVTGGALTVSPLSTTSYSVTGTGTNNCVSASAAVANVTVNATPTLAVNSGSICSGKSFTVVPTGAGTYTIAGGNLVVSPLTNTTYTVAGTSTAGCIAATTVTSTVTVFASPTLAVNSATVCSGNSVVITPGGSATYTITGNSFTVTPLTTTSYSVTGTSTAGCISANTAISQVSVNATPTIVVTNTTVCSGLAAVISHSGAATYTITGGTFTVSPNTTTSYSVTGTSTAGCTAANPAIVIVSIDVTPTVSINSATVCSGASVALVPAGANTYTITGGSFTVNPVSTSDYSLTGTSAAGCVSTNTAVATVWVNANPTVSVNSAVICLGSSVTLMPAGADTYTISGNSFTVSPGTTSSYTVTGTDLNGCVSAEAVTEVTVNALPAVAISGSTLVCAFSTTSLSASGAVTYTWNEGQPDATISITPSVNTTYTVTGTDANGCMNAAIVSIVADPCTGIANQNKAGLIFGVYPNPNHGEFVVETVENAEVLVLNALGQIVHSEKTTSAKTSISINHLANGIYFVKVIANGNQQTVKLVKE